MQLATLRMRLASESVVNLLKPRSLTEIAIELTAVARLLAGQELHIWTRSSTETIIRTADPNSFCTITFATHAVPSRWSVYAVRLT